MSSNVQALATGWCPPEELELDVVGVAKGDHGVPGVAGPLDS